MKKPLFLLMLCVVLTFCLNSVCYSQYVIKKISTSPYEDANPQINNKGHVVWEGYDGTDWEIFLYNGIETIQLTDNSYDDVNPQINNNGYVVWEGQSCGGTDQEIFLYDGTTTIQLTDNSYEDNRPQINDNGYVVWQGQLSGGSNSTEIFLYDGFKTIRLTDNSYDDVNPQINNKGYVVWAGADASNVLQIFLYDGIETIQLTSGYDYKEYPRINDKGDVVWFVGFADEHPGIYLYNGTEVIWLTENLGGENEHPEINDNGHVVWTRWDGEDTEIMLFDGHEIVQLTNNLAGDNEPKINNKGDIAWTRSTTLGPSIIVYNGITSTELTISSGLNPKINDAGFVVFERGFDIYLASPRVLVISPNGGEIVPSGSSSLIQWIGLSVAVKYKVEYSMDNGLTWNAAHEEPYVTGSNLNWNVPVPDGNKRECFVRVTGFGASGKAVSGDRSDAPFMIEVIKLIQPNGGEVLKSGAAYPIQWKINGTKSPVTKVNLYYSMNNGANYVLIKSISTVDPGTRPWAMSETCTLPTPLTNKKNICYIKVRAYSGNTFAGDRSDKPFTIEVVKILQPNERETLSSDSSYEIKWEIYATKSPVTKVNLYYTTDGGVSYVLISSISTVDPKTRPWAMSHSWKLPPLLTNKKNTCYVKVKAYNGSTVVGSDTSDKPFTIDVVKIIQPDGGETLSSDSSYEIKWEIYATKSPVEKVNLYYTVDGGVSYVLISTLAGSDRSYNWTPTVNSTKPNCKIKVVIYDAKNTVMTSDVSDSHFIISPSSYVTSNISNRPYYDDNDGYEPPHLNNNGEVVWSGYDGTDWEIFLYDGTKTIQLTDNAYDDLFPQISDNGHVVWEGWVEAANSEIFLYNGTDVLQLTNNSSCDSSPRINNKGHVVWWGCDGSGSEIYFYDGTMTIQLTDTSYYNLLPQINDNDYVAWYGSVGGYQVYLYDGSSIIQLADYPYHIQYPNHPPRINESGQVVWGGLDPHKDFQIFLYDGTKTIQLTNNSYWKEHPDINNNGHVVWEGYDGPDTEIFDSEIFLYNGIETIQLTDNSYDDRGPQINDSGHIVWYGESDRDDFDEIFFYDGRSISRVTYNIYGEDGAQINNNDDVIWVQWGPNWDTEIFLASKHY